MRIGGKLGSARVVRTLARLGIAEPQAFPVASFPSREQITGTKRTSPFEKPLVPSRTTAVATRVRFPGAVSSPAVGGPAGPSASGSLAAADATGIGAIGADAADAADAADTGSLDALSVGAGCGGAPVHPARAANVKRR